MFSPEQKEQLLINLDIEGTVLLTISLYPVTHPISRQSHTAPANSNHGSQTLSQRSAIATNVN
jgi:hypothetical protein